MSKEVKPADDAGLNLNELAQAELEVASIFDRPNGLGVLQSQLPQRRDRA